MFPATRNLVIADGQVEDSSTAIMSDNNSVAGRYNLTFTNVGSNTETLIITYSRDGGTQRRLRQVTLAVDEVYEITGLPVNKDDSVYAVTTTADSVDYVISAAPDEAPLNSMAYDSDGLPRMSPQILEQLALVFSS